MKLALVVLALIVSAFAQEAPKPKPETKPLKSETLLVIKDAQLTQTRIIANMQSAQLAIEHAQAAQEAMKKLPDENKKAVQAVNDSIEAGRKECEVYGEGWDLNNDLKCEKFPVAPKAPVAKKEK